MNLMPSKQRVFHLLPDAITQTCGPRQGNARYLSFDDGPHPEYTPRLLDLLARHGARASFFVVGRHAECQPAIVERIVREGHLLGNHSWNHLHFAQLPLGEQLVELERTDALLHRFDGRARHRVRPPQGLLPLPLLWHLAWRRRSIAYWSYDSLDYRLQTTAELVARLRRQPPQAGDIVLLHDDHAHTCEALDELLPQWVADGHSFLPLAPERA